MAEIKNLEEAKLAAQNVVKAAQEQQKTIKFNFEEVLKEISEINPELGGFEELAILLELPEEQFAILGPIFLEELEKSYNNVEDQLQLVQAMNVAGIRAEDAAKEYQDLCREIDTQMLTVLSAPKRDFLKQLLGLTYNAIQEAEGITKRVVFIPLEKCHPNAKTPAYAHESDAGLDVYALEDITIAPGETKLIPLGIKCALPLGYELQVRPKSGRCLKTKLRIANTPGTIDAGYRDEIGVIIDNIEPVIRHADMDENGRLYNILWGQSYTIGKGEKFAQLVLSEVPKAAFYEVETVANIGEDRKGGFGSTGVK